MSHIGRAILVHRTTRPFLKSFPDYARDTASRPNPVLTSGDGKERKPTARGDGTAVEIVAPAPGKTKMTARARWALNRQLALHLRDLSLTAGHAHRSPMMIKMEEIESDFGTINILKSRSTGSVIYDIDGSSQSVADSNGTSMASYIHAFFGLLTHAKARNILLVGCGGGTLATMLARARRNVTMVDINPASFALSKKYFGLPDTVVCHVEDGKSFLRKDTATYDAIVLDAFLGDHTPSHLGSVRFFELVRNRLTPRGAVFANVVVKNDFDDKADQVAHAMTKVWPNVRVLDSERVLGRNAIVMAGRVGHLRAPYVLVPPATEANRIDKALALMKYRSWSIDRWGSVG